MPFPMPAALTRAKSYLLAQGERQFAETRHVMRFPRRAGFRTGVEEQSCDVFARAVLAGVLLDTADRDASDVPFQKAVHALARRDAAHVAAAKLTDRAGGWSYFPNLPELPPDLDSLAAALALFARVAPEFLPLCEEPVAIALNQAHPDGALETWIIAESDAAADRKLMRWGVDHCWGRGTDIDVCARFYHALALADSKRYAEEVRRGVRLIESRQRPDGGWDATWYWGQAQACELGMRLLRTASTGDDAQDLAARFLLESQRVDGGWGVWETVPLDTAIALWALAEAGSALTPPQAIARAVHALLGMQTLQGFWKGSPWIKMEIGRAAGRITRTATYQSATLTTAFCLRALIATRDGLPEVEGRLPSR